MLVVFLVVFFVVYYVENHTISYVSMSHIAFEISPYNFSVRLRSPPMGVRIDRIKTNLAQILGVSFESIVIFDSKGDPFEENYMLTPACKFSLTLQLNDFETKFWCGSTIANHLDTDKKMKQGMAWKRMDCETRRVALCLGTSKRGNLRICDRAPVPVVHSIN